MIALFCPAYSMSMVCSAERVRQGRCSPSLFSSLPVKTAPNKGAFRYASELKIFSVFVTFNGTSNAHLSWNLRSKSRRNVDKSQLRIQYGGLRHQQSVKTVRFVVYRATRIVFAPLIKSYRLYCAVIARVVFVFHTQIMT